MSLGIFDLPEDGLDPVEASSRVARTIKAAIDELHDRGIVEYLSLSGSDEEFEARLASRDCFVVVASVAEKHLSNFENPIETLVGQLKARTSKSVDCKRCNGTGRTTTGDAVEECWPCGGTGLIDPISNNKKIDEKDYNKYVSPHKRDWEVEPSPKSWPVKDVDKVNWNEKIEKKDFPRHTSAREDAEEGWNKDVDWSKQTCASCGEQFGNYHDCSDTPRRDKIAFNPSEDTYVLEPKCQVAGCDKNAEKGGVCAEHNVQAKSAQAAGASYKLDEPCVNCGTNEFKMKTVGEGPFFGPLFLHACTNCGEVSTPKVSEGQTSEAAIRAVPCEHCGGSGQAIDAFNLAKKTIEEMKSKFYLANEGLADCSYCKGTAECQDCVEDEDCTSCNNSGECSMCDGRGTESISRNEIKDGDFRNWANRLDGVLKNLRHLPGSIGARNDQCTGCNGTGNMPYRQA